MYRIVLHRIRLRRNYEISTVPKCTKIWFLLIRNEFNFDWKFKIEFCCCLEMMLIDLLLTKVGHINKCSIQSAHQNLSSFFLPKMTKLLPRVVDFPNRMMCRSVDAKPPVCDLWSTFTRSWFAYLFGGNVPFNWKKEKNVQTVKKECFFFRIQLNVCRTFMRKQVLVHQFPKYKWIDDHFRFFILFFFFSSFVHCFVKTFIGLIYMWASTKNELFS